MADSAAGSGNARGWMKSGFPRTCSGLWRRGQTNWRERPPQPGPSYDNCEETAVVGTVLVQILYGGPAPNVVTTDMPISLVGIAAAPINGQ